MNQLSSLPAVYTLTHTPSGYFYIGSTNNLRRRVQEHRTLLKRSLHENKRLQSVYTNLDDFDLSYVHADSVGSANEAERDLLEIYVGHPFAVTPLRNR